MSALPDDALEQQFPEPLEFFKSDAIHPDNQALLDHEQQRWRLLGFFERLALHRYVGQLHRKLNRAHYNQLARDLDQAWHDFQTARADYHNTTFINDAAKLAAKRRLIQCSQRGKAIKARVDELRETYELWQHYQGWLDYEQQHRRELKIEAKREKQIRAEMRQESKWLETLLTDVLRKTPGCHYTYKDDDGKEKTKVPKFERCVITADAHWFYVSTSKRTLFGWKWRLPETLTIRRLTDEEVIMNMRAATKRQVEAVWSETNQLIFRVSRLDSPDAIPRRVKWRDAMRFYPEQATLDLPYTIGVDDRRKFNWFNLVDNPHVLVAGKSQSGKSNLVNGIIGTLVSTHTPDELRLVLIDQKGGLEFTHWKELPHLLWEMIKTVEEVQPVLTKLVAVMRRRMAKLEAVKKKDIAAYNASIDAESRMERILVIIDEMNTFVGLGSLTEDIHNLIMLLVSQGRAVGVHVIAATQHPEVKVIPGRIKTNMSIRLCGAMPTIQSSQIVLDNPEAARIPNIPGRFVAVSGLDTLIVQVPQVFDEDIAGVVSATRRAYPDVRNDLRDFAELPALTIWNEQRVMKAALDWLDGQLSGQKLHKLLGAESPGERHLAKVCRQIIDEANALGSVVLVEDNTKWQVEKIKRGYYLRSQSDQPDNEEAPVHEQSASD